MVPLEIGNWGEITSIINTNDVYQFSGERDAIETNPHVTVLYGLHSNVGLEDIKQALSKFKGKTIDVNITGCGTFNDDKTPFGVVKFNVESSMLHQMNQALSKLPHTNEFDYKPHVTIAYLRKDIIDKYPNKLNLKFSLSTNVLSFSPASGVEDIHFTLDDV